MSTLEPPAHLRRVACGTRVSMDPRRSPPSTDVSDEGRV